MAANSATISTEIVSATATATAVAVVPTATTKPPKPARTDEVMELLVKTCLCHDHARLSFIHGQKKKVEEEIFKLMMQTEQYKAAGSPTRQTLFDWLIKHMDERKSIVKALIKEKTGGTSEEGLTDGGDNPDNKDHNAEEVDIFVLKYCWAGLIAPFNPRSTYFDRA